MSMPAAAPATRATGNAIVSYLAGLTYTGGARVYAFSQLEQILDISDYIANGGACAEVYCNSDASLTMTFGGGKWDVQTWYILSMTSLQTPETAASVYDVRDALVGSLSSQTTLGGTIPGLFFAQWKAPESGRFLRIERNGQEVQAHAIEMLTRLAWNATLVP
jgi:hypothetical protein